MSEQTDTPVEDPPEALAQAAQAERKPTIQDVTDMIGRILNAEWLFERDTRAGAAAIERSGDVQRAIKAYAAADEKRWRVACIEAALARLQAMEPYEDKIRDLIKAERTKAAKAAAKPRTAMRRSA